VGGDQTNALAAIRSGNLADYFTNTAPLTAAAPIWFELKSLTGEVAMVSETGAYSETTCEPRLPGAFSFMPEAAIAIPFTESQRQVASGDMNGDGRMDLVYNERRSSAGGVNRVHVALAGAGGGYSLAAPSTSPADPAAGWENFQMLVADVDGDGRDDLAWNHRGTNNVVYVAMSSGDGTFEWREPQVHPNNGWAAYAVAAGDVNGDGKTDLLWSIRAADRMRVYAGIAQPDSTFTMVNEFTDRLGNHTGYGPPVIAKVDGNSTGDVVHNRVNADENVTVMQRIQPDGSFSTISHNHLLSGWSGYKTLVADIDGQNADDLVFVRSLADKLHIHRAINGGAGAFTRPAVQSMDANHLLLPFMGDVNDDGRADLILLQDQGVENKVWVGYGTTGGTFDFPAGAQTSPFTPGTGWPSFDRIFIGDVNGDGKDDIVWTNASASARIYVALAQ
jgi:hypothetical protein